MAPPIHVVSTIDIKDADPISFTLDEEEKISYTFEQRDDDTLRRKSLAPKEMQLRHRRF
jgi:hypothetical protein